MRVTPAMQCVCSRVLECLVLLSERAVEEQRDYARTFQMRHRQGSDGGPADGEANSSLRARILGVPGGVALAVFLVVGLLTLMREQGPLGGWGWVAQASWQAGRTRTFQTRCHASPPPCRIPPPPKKTPNEHKAAPQPPCMHVPPPELLRRHSEPAPCALSVRMQTTRAPPPCS